MESQIEDLRSTRRAAVQPSMRMCSKCDQLVEHEILMQHTSECQFVRCEFCFLPFHRNAFEMHVSRCNRSSGENRVKLKARPFFKKKMQSSKNLVDDLDVKNLLNDVKSKKKKIKKRKLRQMETEPLADPAPRPASTMNQPPPHRRELIHQDIRDYILNNESSDEELFMNPRSALWRRSAFGFPPHGSPHTPIIYDLGMFVQMDRRDGFEDMINMQVMGSPSHSGGRRPGVPDMSELNPYLRLKKDFGARAKPQPLSKTKVTRKLLRTKICDDCVICYSEFAIDAPIYKTGCGHFYHEGCLKRWIDDKLICPMCRSRLIRKN